jgi:4-amino-4-deoxy-L-arabinose transferase-like glycosyltransferase
LLIAPTVWALIPVWYGGDAGLPFAGPDVLAKARPSEVPNVEPLLDYLLTNRQGETFLLATLNARDAAPTILATGEPVMALGGFTGGDPILTVDELAEYVETGMVRFFLLGPQAGQQRELARWVLEHGVPVPPQLWQATPALAGRPDARLPGGQRLFDCRPDLAGPSPDTSETT